MRAHHQSRQCAFHSQIFAGQWFGLLYLAEHSEFGLHHLNKYISKINPNLFHIMEKQLLKDS